MATNAAVGPHIVWVLNKDQDIFKLDHNSNWKNIPGHLKGISVGKRHVWGVNRDDEILYDTTMNGARWNLVSGHLRQVCKISSYDCFCNVFHLGVCKWIQ